MFAVVKYNDYRKEQSFEIIACTEDVEYAKKMAFNMCRCSFKPAKNSIRTADLYSSWFVTDNDLNPSTFGADLNLQRFNKNAIQKIKTHEKDHFLHPINKIIISYRVVDIADNSVAAIYSTVYAVIEITNPNTNSVLDEVDESLFWTDTNAETDY